MLRQLLFGIALISVVGLSGCAGDDYKQYSRGMQASNYANSASATSYFESKAKMMDAVTSKLAADGDNTALVLFAVMSGQQDAAIVEQLKAVPLVKPATNADIGIAVANNTIPTIVRWGAGAWLGSEIVDGLSTTTYAVGAGSTMNVNSSQAGMGNTVSGEGASMNSSITHDNSQSTDNSDSSDNSNTNSE